MKRLHIALALVASISTSLSAACASPGSGASPSPATTSAPDTPAANTSAPDASPADTPATDDGSMVPAERLSVVCSTFPAYDWISEVTAGQEDRIELTYLLESSVDLHNYQPSVADMATIAASDLFVYVGGESDGWVDDALAGTTNPDQRSPSLLAAVGNAAREEEIVEGMEAEEEERGANGAEDGHDATSDLENEDDGEAGTEHEEGPEYDEHVWLSLSCARTLVGALADELSAIDPAGADAYAENAATHIAKLDELDGRYRTTVEKAPLKVAVFADRFPFRYLFDDYGLSYYAAFVGCSAEAEASFETPAFLAGKVDELGLPAVLAIDGSDQRLAKTVVDTTAKKDQKILVMDSLQSTTASDAASGKTYLEAMGQTSRRSPRRSDRRRLPEDRQGGSTRDLPHLHLSRRRPCRAYRGPEHQLHRALARPRLRRGREWRRQVHLRQDHPRAHTAHGRQLRALPGRGTRRGRVRPAARRGEG